MRYFLRDEGKPGKVLLKQQNKTKNLNFQKETIGQLEGMVTEKSSCTTSRIYVFGRAMDCNICSHPDIYKGCVTITLINTSVAQPNRTRELFYLNNLLQYVATFILAKQMHFIHSPQHNT